jgi:hypothetical protein
VARPTPIRPDSEGAAGSGSGAPSAAGASAHEAPALAEALATAPSSAPRRVLDAGPASRRNLERYSEVATGVRFLSLDGAALRALREHDEGTFRRRLDELLPIGRETFDLVLLWTVLDYLGPTYPEILCRHLAEAANLGARLHAMVATSSTMPAEPDRFEIAAPGLVVAAAATTRVTAPPGTAPAQVERWLRPFEVERSILLRHGVRETLAVRR